MIWEALVDKLYFLGQVEALAALGYGAWLTFRGRWKLTDPLVWKSGDFRIPEVSVPSQVPCEGITAASLSPSELRLRVKHNHALYGNAAIEAQHERLSASAETLRAAITAGRPMGEVNGIIDGFVRDMTRHFRDEEAIFAVTAYPRAAEHAALHCVLLEKVNGLVRQFRAGLIGINELFQFLANDVLAKHVQEEENEFGAYSVVPA